MTDELVQVARLLQQRNRIDSELGAVTGRPVVAGHLGEWIASRIFGIALETSATAKAIDGRFSAGPLDGKTVNVKWYGKQEGLLDISTDPRLDYYLVLAGPRGPAASSRGTTRPLVISAVHLFATQQLLGELRERGVKIGTATSVRASQWAAAEIYPTANSAVLQITDEQRRLLELFAPSD